MNEKPMMLVRVYLSEADRGHEGSLLDDILRVLHEQHRVHGATVFRGIAGFGDSGMVHSADLLRLTQRLPLVVEFYDEPSVIDSVLEALAPLIPSGHVIRWPITCSTGNKA